MTRYVTNEEKLTCKYCEVEFTERELIESERMCPRCNQYPFDARHMNKVFDKNFSSKNFGM